MSEHYESYRRHEIIGGYRHATCAKRDMEAMGYTVGRIKYQFPLKWIISGVRNNFGKVEIAETTT